MVNEWKEGLQSLDTGRLINIEDVMKVVLDTNAFVD